MQRNILMNVQKLIVIAIAILINAVALALFNVSTPVSGTAAAIHTRVRDIPTLPAIEVHPSASELREWHRARETAGPKQVDATTEVACAGMPYYSFAAPCSAALEG